jgi:hypothetical protein
LYPAADIDPAAPIVVIRGISSKIMNPTLFGVA